MECRRVRGRDAMGHPRSRPGKLDGLKRRPESRDPAGGSEASGTTVFRDGEQGKLPRRGWRKIASAAASTVEREPCQQLAWHSNRSRLETVVLPNSTQFFCGCTRPIRGRGSAHETEADEARGHHAGADGGHRRSFTPLNRRITELLLQKTRRTLRRSARDLQATTRKGR